MSEAESPTPWWHNYLCTWDNCDAGSTGLIIDVRTDWEDAPDGVTCPYCGSEMEHQASWQAASIFSAADRPRTPEDLYEDLRSMTSSELMEFFSNLRVVLEWASIPGVPKFELRSPGEAEPVAIVEARFAGSSRNPFWEWVAYVGEEDVGCADNPEEAMAIADQTVSAQGYLVPWMNG